MNKIIPLHGYASELNQTNLSEAEVAIGFSNDKSTADLYVGNGTGYVKVGGGMSTTVPGDTVSQTLAAYTEYRCTGGASGTANEGRVTHLTISMPQTVSDDYISIIHFTTGLSPDPTHFSYPANILMCGTDVDIETVTEGNTTTSKYAFDVQANTRYTIAFEWDGAYVRGYVTGVKLI